MALKRLSVSLIVTALLIGVASQAWAHGLIGQRFFPATLAIDDPFVADELSLPTISFMRFHSSDEGPGFRQWDISGEFSKRLSPNLGLSLGGNFTILDPAQSRTESGFDNMEVSLKYVFFKSAAHETLLSAGVSWDVGGTGSKRIGAESFDTVTPQLFFGKGLGDLPDSLGWLKPIALTGAFGVELPTRRFNKTITVSEEEGEEGGAVEVEKELNPKVVQWGFTLQYNLQYLQSFVRDVGPRAGHTTGTINPGIIWFGRYFQVGLELQIPVNRESGKNVGVLAQLHFYLDDIAPKIFTWTPFHGVQGPTQPR